MRCLLLLVMKLLIAQTRKRLRKTMTIRRSTGRTMRRSNKPAAIKRAAWMIFALLIAYASPEFAPAGVRGQQRVEKQMGSETVRLSADIIDRRQCVQLLGDGSRDELLRL